MSVEPISSGDLLARVADANGGNEYFERTPNLVRSNNYDAAVVAGVPVAENVARRKLYDSPKIRLSDDERKVEPTSSLYDRNGKAYGFFENKSRYGLAA